MPFTIAQFFDVFREYNEHVWPAQIILLAAAVVAVAGMLLRSRWPNVILAAMFIWCGVVYHWVHFTRVNPAAWLFGLIFIAGAVPLILHRNSTRLGEGGASRIAIGSVLIAYGLVLYPIFGFVAGHRYPATPTFGAPCPLTIVAIGLLVTAKRPLPASVLVAPLLWSLIGSTGAFALGVPQDFGLAAAGVTLFASQLRSEPRPSPATERA